MKDKLIELLQKADETVLGFSIDGDIGILADHLLSNGVIVPPCKVGQKVYYPIWHTNKVMELVVREIVYEKNKLQMWASYLAFTVDAIGKTVFLTREEAEKALAGSEGEG